MKMSMAQILNMTCSSTPDRAVSRVLGEHECRFSTPMICSSGYLTGKRGVDCGLRDQDTTGYFWEIAEKRRSLEAVRLTGASFSTFRAIL
jgi:hypothetical protein